MRTEQLSENFKGMSSAGGAYFLWGILPVYWKLVKQVPAHEVLAHRIIWSFFFMIFIIVITKRTGPLINELRQIIADSKKVSFVAIASLLISINWFTYIWAVNDNRIVETSLGYYINPLVSVLLGIIVLKEKLSFWQIVSFVLATIGVIYMTYNFGSIPWVALLLAASFGLYGLFKKMVNIKALTSITLETLIISPIAFIYLTHLEKQGLGVFYHGVWSISGLLIGTGIVTAIPLLLFANGANHLPLKILGFLQYISPTIALIIGVFVYHEAFTATHLVSFSFIWLALTVFSLSRTKPFVWFEEIVMRKYIVACRK